MRRLLVPLLAALTAAALALDPGLAAEEKGHDHHAHMFMDCSKACGDCQRACDSCATHCTHLVAQGKKEHLTTLRTCQDCATHCAAAACITARRGPFADLICTACAEACARCGKECEKFSDDTHMKQCADECKKCERACREMLKHVGTGGESGK